MAKDPEYEDRLSALQAKDDARLSIVQMLWEYPDFIRKAHSVILLSQVTKSNHM